MGINRVNISGNLTRDPELRATGSGMQILRFGVAVNDRARNQQPVPYSAPGAGAPQPAAADLYDEDILF